MEKAVAVTAF